MRLALYQPEIALNVGTILRLGACLDVPAEEELVGVFIFDFHNLFAQVTPQRARLAEGSASQSLRRNLRNSRILRSALNKEKA